MDISHYFLHVINTSQWKEIKNDLNSDCEFIKIPVGLLSDHFPKLSEPDLFSLVKTAKKRVVFEAESEGLSADKNGTFVKIRARITMLGRISPYPIRMKLKCRGCKKKWIEDIEVPVLNPVPNDFPCGNTFCDNFIRNRPINDAEIDYIDAFTFTLEYDDMSITAYTLKLPEIGFMHVYEKAKSALAFNADIYVYGFCRIIRADHTNSYFIHVQDIDIIEKRGGGKIIPFMSFEEPTSEKEMVMGSFFANLEYMRNYLGFNTYELQRKYPDIILYTPNGRIVAEFEYDVANFYHHKHHKQEPKCDLIIAWKCSTPRRDFPYILMESLKGTYVSERGMYADPSEMFRSLIEIILSQFPDVSPKSAATMVFPVIDANLPIRTIQSDTVTLSYPDDFSPKKISFLLPKTPRHVILSDNGIRIEIEKTDASESVYSMDAILDVKDYLEYLRRENSPPILYEKGVIDKIYSATGSIENTDVILVLISLLANFFGLSHIDSDFVDYFFELYPQFAEKF